MPQPPLLSSETQEAQMSPGQGKSKAARAKARKKRKAAAAATTPALAVQPSPPRASPPSPKATPKQAPVAPVPSVHDYASDVKASPPPSVVLSQSLPSLSSYQNSTPPPPSPPPPAIASSSPAHPEGDADDGFIVVSRARKPKTTQPIPNPVDVEEAERLQFWWNNGFRPPDNTWDWQTEPERRASKVETWLEGLQQLTTPLDPPETQVIEHAVEPKQSVVPKRVQQRIAAAMPKPKPQVRWGK